MRKVKLFATLIAAVSVALFAGGTLAFHDGGVAHCNGCHTMHNSEDGALVDADSPDGNAWLLRDATPSDVCLSCHATGLGAVFATDVMNPAREIGGGNFIFLLEDNINDGHGGGDLLDPNDPGFPGLANAIPGDAAGHNLDAPGFGLSPDGTLSTAPGGTFPAALLGCSSCHDPHGRETFRLLYGSGLVQDFYTFTAEAPDAVGNSIFGGPPESNSFHTAYKGGTDNMSAWCGNCHGNFHNNNTQLIHPSGQTMGAGIAQTYNLYNGTSDQTGGGSGTSYLAAVPFEDSSVTTTSTTGPTASSLVSCITCHRAHATSAPDAGRWDFDVTFLHEDGVESDSYPIPDPYNDLNQRSLCNKCHNKDAFDEMPF
jgi:hypothetical protein